MTQEILRQLISIPSVTTQENSRITDFLEKKLSTLNPKRVTLSGFDGKLLHNLIVDIKGVQSSLPPLILVAHTDTVAPTTDWTTDPFVPVVVEKKQGTMLQGLGSVDTKSGVSMLASVLLSCKNPSRTIIGVFDCDEERRSESARMLISQAKIPKGNVIVLEPTNGNIGYGQRGCLAFHITTTGTAMHASLTSYENNIKHNAIYRALNIMNRLVEYDKSLSTKGIRQKTFNIGMIAGGSGGNTVAQNCTFKVERRLLADEKIDLIETELRNMISIVDPSAIVETSFRGEPYQLSQSDIFVQKINEIVARKNASTKKIILPFWTEASIFSACGPCVIFGPGDPTQAHSADEAVLLTVYEQCLEELQDIVTRF